MTDERPKLSSPVTQLFLQGIPKESWDSLLRPDESPFLEHDWIYAMEESECAAIDAGAAHVNLQFVHRQFSGGQSNQDQQCVERIPEYIPGINFCVL